MIERGIYLHNKCTPTGAAGVHSLFSVADEQLSLTLFQLTNAALSFLQSPEFAPEDRRPRNGI